MIYRDLEDLIGAPYPRPMLYCRHCRGEFSAHRGDYFLCPDEKEILCNECGIPLVRVREVTHFVEC